MILGIVIVAAATNTSTHNAIFSFVSPILILENIFPNSYTTILNLIVYIIY